MGKQREQEAKFKNFKTGEVITVEWVVDEDEVWGWVIDKCGEKNEDVFQNELCNLGYYEALRVWGEKREELGISDDDAWDWELDH